MNRKSQFDQLAKRCREAGWVVRRTTKGHLFIRTPDGSGTTFPLTSGGYGTPYKNAEAWCKRHGLYDEERQHQ